MYGSGQLIFSLICQFARLCIFDVRLGKHQPILPKKKKKKKKKLIRGSQEKNKTEQRKSKVKKIPITKIRPLMCTENKGTSSLENVGYSSGPFLRSVQIWWENLMTSPPPLDIPTSTLFEPKSLRMYRFCKFFQTFRLEDPQTTPYT